MSGRLQDVRVGKHVAYAGLHWRDCPGSSPPELREQIRAAAEAYRSRYGVLVQAGRSEVGMVPELSQKQGRSGASAAAWLAMAYPSPVLYVQDMPQGQYWVVHTDAGYVDPRTDVVCDEDDARSLIDSLLETQIQPDGVDLRIIINAERRPSSVMLDRVSNIEKLDFGKLVGTDAPPASVRFKQMVGITPATILLLFGFLLMCAGIWAGMTVWQKIKRAHAFEAERAALAVQEAEMARIKTERELRMKLAVDQAAKEDTATPAPNTIMNACATRLDKLGEDVGGWTIIDATCRVDGTGLAVNLRAPSATEGVGTAETLIADAARRGLPVTIDPASRTASLDVPLTPPVPRSGIKPAQMPPARETVTGIMARLQLVGMATGVTFQMTPPAPRSVTYVDPEHENSTDPTQKFQPVPAEMSYARGTITMMGKARWEIDTASYDYPFMTLEKLEFRPSPDQGYTWQLEALYVTRG